jgi:hypothetical protein
MGLIGEWRAARERRRRADGYLRGLLSPPPTTDIDWLAAIAGDRTVAERELIFARRALGLVVAERDALDDRTAADVSHALTEVVASEARRSASVAAQWTARRRAYSEVLAVRGQAEAPVTRFARVLLAGAGVAEPSEEALGRAAHFIQSTRTHANEALRATYGMATLPDDVRPSAIRT